MIRVTPAPPPADFDACVRQPGLDAIAELVGEPPSKKRRGPKRTKIAERREDIPADKFPPYWQRVEQEMKDSYHNLCAYLALNIAHGTGSSTIDHFIPIRKDWQRVYEWSNYRLACGLMNARKSDIESVIDPFEVQDGDFVMEFVEYQVKPGVGLMAEVEQQITDTISQLRLNDEECCKARQAYVEAYRDAEILLSYLERCAPLIARELRRQGMLREGDT